MIALRFRDLVYAGGFVTALHLAQQIIAGIVAAHFGVTS